MINNLLITGAAGTGKTYEITERVKEFMDKGISAKEIQILSFNKSLKAKFEEVFPEYPEIETRTCHSFCYSVLENNKMLPEAFIKKETSEKDIKNFSLLSLGEEGISAGDYTELITRVNELPDIAIRKVVNPIKLLVVDEVQDLKTHSFNLIKRLHQVFNFNLILGGDRLQQIYKYLANNRYLERLDPVLYDHFKIAKDYFQIPFEEITLTTNYRCKNDKIIEFVNAFLVKLFKEEGEKLQYKSLAEVTVSKPVEVLYAQDKQTEMKYILENIKQINKKDPNATIAILCRWKRYLKHLEKAIEESKVEIKNTTFHTIHSFKGLQADYVFIPAYDFNMDRDYYDTDVEKEVLYVAITRACKELYITTSNPKRECSFDSLSDYVTIIDKQKHLKKKNGQSVMYTFRHDFTKKRNLNLSKMQIGHIDTLKFRITYENAPFDLKIRHSNSYKSDHTSNKKYTDENGFPYTIVYNHGLAQWFFEFFDLNLLKRHSFSDKDIVHYLMNIVYRHFDQRILPENVIVSRIDLYKMLTYSSREERMEYIRYWTTFFRYSKAFTAYDNTKVEEDEDRFNYMDNWYPIPDLDNKTFYINSRKSLYNTFSLAMYSPCNKVNMNRIDNDKCFKLEARYKGDQISKKYAFGKEMNVKNLLECIKNNELDGVYKRSLQSLANPIEDILQHGNGINKGTVRSELEKLGVSRDFREIIGEREKAEYFKECLSNAELLARKDKKKPKE